MHLRSRLFPKQVGVAQLVRSFASRAQFCQPCACAVESLAHLSDVVTARCTTACAWRGCGYRQRRGGSAWRRTCKQWCIPASKQWCSLVSEQWCCCTPASKQWCIPACATLAGFGSRAARVQHTGLVVRRVVKSRAHEWPVQLRTSSSGSPSTSRSSRRCVYKKRRAAAEAHPESQPTSQGCAELRIHNERNTHPEHIRTMCLQSSASAGRGPHGLLGDHRKLPSPLGRALDDVGLHGRFV